MHVSLRDTSTGKNLFSFDGEGKQGRTDAKYKDVAHLSPLGEHFLAGLMHGLPDVLPLLCPNINSYKRLAGGETFWAPNICSYGYDSRVASVRILGPPDLEKHATRFEVRIPGADVNAPLGFAAIFALGLYGIENKLELPFGPVAETNKADLPRLATTLEAATERFMAKESIAWKIFTKEFVEHYGLSRRHEVQLFNTAVTNWERERYLELT
jgi:glutamine synthetase